jgi:hypothetical protein
MTEEIRELITLVGLICYLIGFLGGMVFSYFCREFCGVLYDKVLSLLGSRTQMKRRNRER